MDIQMGFQTLGDAVIVLILVRCFACIALKIRIRLAVYCWKGSDFNQHSFLSNHSKFQVS